VRSGDTVARVGGDEFAVLLTELDATDTRLQLVERLREVVCRVPVPTSAGDVNVTASFGLAVGERGDEPDELLARADAALCRAKRRGGGHVLAFDQGEEISVSALADEFAIAVSRGFIRPYVHGVVDLATGTLVGYQGLARWDHPERGLLDAASFMPVVANSPVAPVVDLAVLRRTAAAAARATRRGSPTRAYGHLSRRLLGDIDVERYLSEMTTDLDLDPGAICIEIAHPLVARHSRAVATTLRGLRELGVRTVLSAVDGACAVNEIVDYGFEELRLSLPLVRDAGTDPDRRRVAHGTIALGRALGLTVIAVGIETEEQRADLLDAGCHLAEGYLFGGIMPAGAVE
jgi:predicted signal transduction protein with EAL and GGDEF domain